MPVDNNIAELSQGFSKLNRSERLARLLKMGALTRQEIEFLRQSEGLSPKITENFIENVIGSFPMPLGVATNFRINDKDYVIPMAVEETSIIAAASKNAKWIRQQGHIKTEMIGQNAIGQIQISHVTDFPKFKQLIEDNKKFLIEAANQEPAKGLYQRGGGVNDIQVRHIQRDDQSAMAVIHILVNTCDAMGANVIGQICEYLKQPIQNLTQEKVTLCILSNLVDTKLTRATVTIHNIDIELGEAIAEAALFAQLDPYRAATHNKGTLNGIDGVLIATGNDWRAVEAGVHAYAARTGRYRAITQWQMQGKDLVGQIEAPIIVGIVGGVTKLHPTAQLCLKMLNVDSAAELSQIVAAAGLVQNLGAIKALTTFSFIQGHMKLHIDNIAMATNANSAELTLLKQGLAQYLEKYNRISVSDAQNILKKIRKSIGVTTES